MIHNERDHELHGGSPQASQPTVFLPDGDASPPIQQPIHSLPPAQSPPTTYTYAPAPRRKRGWLIGVSGVVVLAIAAGGAFWFLTSDDSGPATVATGDETPLPAVPASWVEGSSPNGEFTYAVDPGWDTLIEDDGLVQLSETTSSDIGREYVAVGSWVVLGDSSGVTSAGISYWERGPEDTDARGSTQEIAGNDQAMVDQGLIVSMEIPDDFAVVTSTGVIGHQTNTSLDLGGGFLHSCLVVLEFPTGFVEVSVASDVSADSCSDVAGALAQSVSKR